ncbi:MAG: T9SS type A sorting domain-containing protein [Candidatus Coatesbacteria bacterium]|nr:T9SS type A sorting domain-containing protein [Candidatus Coatesbacteria bacterium]
MTEGEFTVGPERTVTMTYPNGGETFYNGEKYYLTWDCTDNVSTINIYGSTDNGLTWLPDRIASSEDASKKTYLWTVDTSKFPETTQGRMKITDIEFEEDIFDIDDGVFTVSNDMNFKEQKTKLPIPKETGLWINPNPCRNRIMKIEYALPSSSKISLKVRNLIGQTVAVLMDSEFQIKGNHRINWVPVNLSSGIFIVELTTEGKTIFKPILILK